MPVGTYIVATEPLGAERAAALIRNNAAVTDINWVLDYFRRSADHRLLFGGRVSYSGLDPFNTAHATRARMLAVFPQLADARHRARLGRVCRYHHESRAGLRPPRAGCVLPAGIFRSRHRADRTRRQAGRRGHCRARRSVSMCSRESSTGTFRVARCCADPRWCWRCCSTGCATCSNARTSRVHASPSRAASPPPGKLRRASACVCASPAQPVRAPAS